LSPVSLSYTYYLNTVTRTVSKHTAKVLSCYHINHCYSSSFPPLQHGLRPQTMPRSGTRQQSIADGERGLCRHLPILSKLTSRSLTGCGLGVHVHSNNSGDLPLVWTGEGDARSPPPRSSERCVQRMFSSIAAGALHGGPVYRRLDGNCHWRVYARRGVVSQASPVMQTGACLPAALRIPSPPHHDRGGTENNGGYHRVQLQGAVHLSHAWRK
jgi:hypothetical protein